MIDTGLRLCIQRRASRVIRRIGDARRCGQFLTVMLTPELTALLPDPAALENSS